MENPGGGWAGNHMSDTPLYEGFAGPDLSASLKWRCEPGRWSIERSTPCLRIEPDAKTDFWQRTHYGFEFDNGHFLFLEAAGDFVLTTKVTSRPVHQYDQAGLMVRVSPSCWLKTSVEYEPHGDSRLGAVVTNAQHSDWSTQPFPKGIATVWLRVRASGNDCLVEASQNGSEWQQIRMAHLHERAARASVACGLYACSPMGAGFQAEFSFLQFEPSCLRQ